jgi:hypothetical protein
MSESGFGGVGRPHGDESKRRGRELLRLLQNGSTLKQAARELHMKGDTVLTLLDEPEYFAVVAALTSGRAQSVAVIVGHDQALEAA